MQPRRKRSCIDPSDIALLVAFATFLSACAGEVGNTELGARTEARSEPSNDLRLASNGPATAPALHAASGYLRRRRSGVDPWCGAVLVDPATALTAAHCVVDAGADSFSVGFGVLGTGTTYRVRDVVLHPSYRSGSSLDDVAILRLDHPANEVEPASLTLRSLEPENVTLVSYVFVLAGQTGERRIFDGQADRVSDSELTAVFPGSETNCHGEGGAGLFGRFDGVSDELLGIGSSGSYDSPHPLSPACIGRLSFAPVAHNRDFFSREAIAFPRLVR